MAHISRLGRAGWQTEHSLPTSSSHMLHLLNSIIMPASCRVTSSCIGFYRWRTVSLGERSDGWGLTCWVDKGGRHTQPAADGDVQVHERQRKQMPESWSSLRRRRPRFEKNGVGASSLDVLLCTRGVGNTAPVFRSCGAISDCEGRK